MDILVEWLVRAVCFMFVSIAGHFLKRVHGLRDENLVTDKICFLHTKPGLPDLFRTYYAFASYATKVRTMFAAHDDEFDRIAKTLDQTMDSIKSMYRYLYRKILFEWHVETVELVTNITPITAQQDIELKIVLRFKLLIGVAFCAAFVNDFRKQSNQIRIAMNQIKDELVLVPIGERTAIECEFITFWQYCRLWFDERGELETALPLQSSYWRGVVGQTFQSIHTNYSVADVDIDLDDPEIAVVNDE